MAQGTIEQRGPKTWRIRADAGPDPVSGKRRQISRTIKADRKRDAQDALRDLLTEIGLRQHDATQRLTFAQAADRWHAHAAPGMSPSSAAGFRRALDYYAIPELGPVRLDKLKAYDLDAAYHRLLAHGGQGGRPLSPATIRKTHAAVRLVLAQAVRWGWIQTNPALQASPPSVPARSATTPAPDQARAIMAEAERTDPEWATIVRLSAALGARRGEVCGLRWNAVDLDAGAVSIARVVVIGEDGKLQVRDTPKTARGRRRVAVDKATVAALRAQKKRQQERALACGTRPARDAYVFSLDPAGREPLRPDAVTHRFMRLRKRLGLTVRLHDLRHFAATQMLGAGVDVRTVAGRLGQDPRVTLATYADWLPANDKEAADTLGAILDG